MKKFAVLLILVSLTTNFLIAQKNNEQLKLNSNAKNNLIAALNSDNSGLKKSAVYFAGYYKIQETVEPLSDMLESSSTDMSLKTLAAYSLHQIGDDECLNALKEAADNDNNRHLCSKCKLMYEDLIQAKTRVTYQ